MCVSVCSCVHVGRCAQKCSPPLESDHFSMIAAVSIANGAKIVALYAESHRCSEVLSLVRLATSKDHKHLPYCTNNRRKGSAGWKQMAGMWSYYKQMLGNDDVTLNCLIWGNSAPASGDNSLSSVHEILYLEPCSYNIDR